ncbi:MAG: filamentous hemagglutinin N-terminal domain-containing protein [Candidatus Omnitrophica bacterium]|nr:filamentous hemagglutinin N-terminal domain-containing protein [Candidatus Omnitrophota bacterium]MDD5487985.1 filamentous hemagglutinin N-terminal domain-containing protein [Candidatus Omnitrophota bacterium]
MKMTGLLKRTVSVLVVFSFLNAQVAYSLPQDVEVVEGAADVNIEGATMTINADAGTILNYSSFDLAEGESVIINLPGIDADILNRVIGAGASNIAGAISCNGLFILVNTSGIYLASTANIDVGSLVLSTRDITNSDFVNGKYFFQKISEEALDTLLKNAGTINVREGGFGVLIAGAIENSGMIVAPMGRIHLAAGDAVTLALSSDGLISVAIDEKVASTIHDMDGNPITDQITNTGSIIADGGVVAISAESLTDIFRNAINLDGIVQADTMSSTAGEISITSSSDITLGGGISAVGGMIGVISEEGSIRAEETSEMTAQDVYVEAQRDISLEGTIETMEGGLVDLHALNGSMYSHGSIIAPEGEINVCAAYDLDLGGFYKASRMVFDPEEVNITSDWTGSGDTTFWATGNINVQANMTLEEGSFYFYADSTDASGTYDDGSGTFTQSSSSTITADYDISIDGSGSVSVGGVVSNMGSIHIGQVTGNHDVSYIGMLGSLYASNEVTLYSDGDIHQGGDMTGEVIYLYPDHDSDGSGQFQTSLSYVINGMDLYLDQSTDIDISNFNANVEYFYIGNNGITPSSVTIGGENHVYGTLDITSNGDIVQNGTIYSEAGYGLYLQPDYDNDGNGQFIQNSGSICNFYEMSLYQGTNITLDYYMDTYNVYGINIYGEGEVNLNGGIYATSDLYVYANDGISLGGPLHFDYYLELNADYDNDGYGSLVANGNSISPVSYFDTANITTAGDLNVSDIESLFSGDVPATSLTLRSTAGNITLDQYYDPEFLYSLQLIAADDINLNEWIALSYGNVGLIADYDGDGDGNFNFSSAGISAGSVTFSKNSDFSITSDLISDIDASNITFTAGGDSDLSVDASLSCSGALNLQADGDISINYGVSTGTTFSVVADYDTDNSGNVIWYSGVSASMGTGGTLRYQQADSFAYSDVTSRVYGQTTGGVTLRSTNGSVTVDQAITLRTGIIDLRADEDLLINSNISTTSSSTMYLYADAENNGSGGFMQSGSASITSGGTAQIALRAAGTGSLLGDITAGRLYLYAQSGGATYALQDGCNVDLNYYTSSYGLYVASNAIFNGGNNTTISTGGDWWVDGTFNGQGSTAILDGTYSGTKDIRMDAGSFNNLTINASGTYSPYTSTTPTVVAGGDLSITAGILSMTTNDLVVGGDLLIDGGVLIANGAGVDIDVDGDVLIRAGDFFAPTGLDDVSFTVGGGFEVSGAGDYYNGNGRVVFDSSDIGNDIILTTSGSYFFNDVKFSGGGEWTLTGLMLASGDLYMYDGTLVAGGLIIAADTLAMDGGNITSDGNDVEIIASTFTQTAGAITTTSEGDVKISSTAMPGAFTVGEINSDGGVFIGETNAPVTVSQTSGTSITAVGDRGIEISASGDITLRQVNSGSYDTTITSTAGSILDGLTGESANITAAAATLTAATGIGVTGSEDLDLDVATLDASVTGTGDIYIWEDSAITLSDVDTSAGKIDISSGGTMTATDVVAGDTGEVWLTTTSGNIQAGVITASGSKVVLAAAGAITDTNGASVNITGSTVDLDAATGISVDTSVNNITADVSGVGNVDISETDDVNINGVSSYEGDIILTSGGVMTVADDISATGFGNISMTADGMNQTGGSIYAPAGEIWIDGAGDIVLGAIEAAGNLTIGSNVAPDSVTFNEDIHAYNSIDVISNGNIDQNADIYSDGSYDIYLRPDYDGDGAGQYSGNGHSLLVNALYIDQSTDMVLNGFTLQNGYVLAGTLSAPSSITVNGDINGYYAFYAESNGNIDVNANIYTQYDLYLDAAGDININSLLSSGDVISIGGSISPSSVTITSAGSIYSGNTVTISSGGDLVFDNLSGAIDSYFLTGNAGSDITVANTLNIGVGLSLDATGNIDAEGSIGGMSETLTLNAGGYIDIAGTATGITAVTIDASGDVTLGGIDCQGDLAIGGTTSPANVHLNGSSTVTGTNTAQISSAGNVAFNGDLVTICGITVSAVNNVTIANSITGVNSDISLYAGGNISHASGTVSTETSGDIYMNGGGDLALRNINSAGSVYVGDPEAPLSITQGTGTVINAGGDISVVSAGDVTLAELISGSGSVSVTSSGGGIYDGLGTTDANITAGSLTLSAATGIGILGGEDVDISADSLFAEVTGPGDIHINEFGSITISSTSTYDGSIDITSEEKMTVSDIAAGGAGDISLCTGSGDLELAGNITANAGNVSLAAGGAFTHISGVIHTDTTGDVSISSVGASSLGDITSAGALNLDTGSAATYGSTGTIDTVGAVVISSGVNVDANSSVWTVGGDWTNNGTFNGDTSSVTLDGASDAAVTGPNTFGDLAIETEGKTVTFEAGETQTVTGEFSAQGSSGVGNLVTLRSSSAGSAWGLDIQGAASVNFADVKDSANVGTEITATNSKDRGGNTGWSFESSLLTWLGVSSTSWDDASNWDLGYVPNVSDSVEIVSAGNYAALVSDVEINSLTIDSGGRMDAGSYRITVSGDWTNAGTFNAGTGTVVFDPMTGTSRISGSTMFNDLTCVTPGSTLVFGSGTTQTVNGRLDISGSVSSRINLMGSVAGSYWHINPKGAISVTNVTVRDSYNDKGVFVDPAGSVDNGKNLFWFTPPVNDIPDETDNVGQNKNNMILEGKGNDSFDPRGVANGPAGTGIFMEDYFVNTGFGMVSSDGSPFFMYHGLSDPDIYGRRELPDRDMVV